MAYLTDPDDVRAFIDWCKNAKPGARYVYHTTMSARRAEYLIWPRDLFRAVYNAYRDGIVFLTQRKDDRGRVYTYTAERTDWRTIARVEAFARRLPWPTKPKRKRK